MTLGERGSGREEFPSGDQWQPQPPPQQPPPLNALAVDAVDAAPPTDTMPNVESSRTVSA